MTARYATAKEIAKWNDLILANPNDGNVFSSFEFSEIKKLTDYTPRYVIVGKQAITVLEKFTPPLGKLWYLPKGPNVASCKQLFDTLKAIRPLAKKAGVFVIKVEPELSALSEPTLKRHGLKKSSPIIPNASTITLDISMDLKTLLSKLPQKGRYAIKRAERDGVTIKKVTVNKKNAQIMYLLLSATADGQFGIRNFKYYFSFWQTFYKAGLGQLFFAYHNGSVVAGAFAMVFGNISTYKDGASVRLKPAYGASHLLQWKVIEWAKSKGAINHDLCGSPPSSEINNPNHPHYKIGLFKLSFSKNVVDYVGCYDYVVSPVRYKVWVKLGERIARHLYFKSTKDFYY